MVQSDISNGIAILAILISEINKCSDYTYDSYYSKISLYLWRIKLIMEYREYRVLKILKKYKGKKDSGYEPKIKILDDDFYSKIKYKKSSINAILKKLEDDKYIVDVFNKMPTTVHTVEITDKGQDALDNYRRSSIKSISSKIIWMIIGALITVFFQAIFKII